jgi:uncharacterized protein YeaO (DUF488 family)
MKRQAAPIRIKRVYDPPDASDGTRILVDRLWPRGLRKDSASLSLWLKEIAPSPGLREWFGHDPDRYGEFARRYQAELESRKDEVARLEDLVKQGAATLLYAAHDEGHNHALVLADYLRNHMECCCGKRPA